VGAQNDPIERYERLVLSTVTVRKIRQFVSIVPVVPGRRSVAGDSDRNDPREDAGNFDNFRCMVAVQGNHAASRLAYLT